MTYFVATGFHEHHFPTFAEALAVYRSTPESVIYSDRRDVDSDGLSDDEWRMAHEGES